MEPEEGKISVWVCREEKLVSGLTRRTTCADVVKVLLEDQNLRQGASAAMLCGPAQSYCVVEKWRGFERTLPNKTKVLRLWAAWAEEQDNVRFVLVRSDASLPNNGPRSAEARVVPSRDPGGCWSAGGGGGGASTAHLSQDKQRRVVRKAFRKLDKMNRKKEQQQVPSRDGGGGSAERMESLVHLVISQDHTLRQQVHRIQQLDREIERCEAQVHLERIRTHGVNYVQDTYLLQGGAREAAEAPCGAEHGAREQLEDYALRCEEVLRLQEELTEREAAVENITAEIQEELNRRWMRRRRQETGGEEEAPEEEEEEVALEEERVRTQLDTSLYIGLRLKTDLDSVRTDLDRSLELWETKEDQLLELLSRVESMDMEQEEEDEEEKEQEEDAIAAGERGAAGAEAEPPSEKNVGWVEQARGLSKSRDANDDDSDTGLSSMHSQDSDNTPVCESLV